MLVVRSSSTSRAAGALIPKKAATSPSTTPLVASPTTPTTPAPTNVFPGALIPGLANVWPLESASPLLDSAAKEVLVPRLGAPWAFSGLPRRPTPPSLHSRRPPAAPTPPPAPGMQQASSLPCKTCNFRATRPGLLTPAPLRT
uniref:Uncharacterized protein n=1 Tax=Zea mays TaxID=4577 RepID=C0PNF0_MAIZE|nr:unknown [Zea mays]